MNDETNNKSLKLFPIFLTSRLKKQKCDVEQSVKIADECKRHCENDHKVNPNASKANSCVTTDSCDVMSYVPVIRKPTADTCKNDSHSKSKESGVQIIDLSVGEQSNLCGTVADKNNATPEVPVIEINLAVKEVIDYLCNGVQQTQLCGESYSNSSNDTEQATRDGECLCLAVPHNLENKDVQTSNSKDGYSVENYISLPKNNLENDPSVNYNDSGSELLKLKRKPRQRKCVKNCSSSNSVEVTELSSRRKSLRGRESTMKNLKNSDLCMSDCIQKIESKRQEHLKDNDKCQSRVKNHLDISCVEVTSSDKQKESISTELTNGENKEEETKFFPIFTTCNNKKECIIERNDILSNIKSEKDFNLPSSKISSKEKGAKNKTSICCWSKDPVASNLISSTDIDLVEKSKIEPPVINVNECKSLTEDKNCLISAVDLDDCVITKSCESNVDLKEKDKNENQDLEKVVNISKHKITVSNEVEMMEVTEISVPKMSLRGTEEIKCSDSKIGVIQGIKSEEFDVQMLSKGKVKQSNKNIDCNISNLEISAVGTSQKDVKSLNIKSENMKETTKLFPIFVPQNPLYSSLTEEIYMSSKGEKGTVEDSVENCIKIVANEKDVPLKRKRGRKKIVNLNSDRNSTIITDIEAEDKCENRSNGTNNVDCNKNPSGNVEEICRAQNSLRSSVTEECCMSAEERKAAVNVSVENDIRIIDSENDVTLKRKRGRKKLVNLNSNRKSSKWNKNSTIITDAKSENKFENESNVTNNADCSKNSTENVGEIFTAQNSSDSSMTEELCTSAKRKKATVEGSAEKNIMIVDNEKDVILKRTRGRRKSGILNCNQKSSICNGNSIITIDTEAEDKCENESNVTSNVIDCNKNSSGNVDKFVMTQNSLHSSATEETCRSTKEKKTTVEDSTENFMTTVDNEKNVPFKKKRGRKKLVDLNSNKRSFICNKNSIIMTDTEAEDKWGKESNVISNVVECNKNSARNTDEILTVQNSLQSSATEEICISTKGKKASAEDSIEKDTIIVDNEMNVPLKRKRGRKKLVNLNSNKKSSKYNKNSLIITDTEAEDKCEIESPVTNNVADCNKNFYQNVDVTFTAQNSLHSSAAEEINISTKREKAIVEDSIENDTIIVVDEKNEPPKKKRGRKKSSILNFKTKSSIHNKNSTAVTVTKVGDKCENKSSVMNDCSKNCSRSVAVDIDNTSKSDVCVIEDSDNSDLISTAVLHKDSNSKASGRKGRNSNKLVNKISNTSPIKTNQEVSNRRQSLRSRGVRDNFINYSDVHLSVESNKVEQKVKTKVPRNTNSKSHNVKNCDKMIQKSKKSSINQPKSDSSVMCNNKNKKREEKQNVFSIFTGQNKSKCESKCVLGKRKPGSDDKNSICDRDIQNLSSKKKKFKEEVNISSSEGMQKSVSTGANDNSNNEKSFTLNIHDPNASVDSEVSIVGDYSVDGRKNNDDKMNPKNNSSKLKCWKNLQRSNQHIIPFPSFSHFTSDTLLLPDTISKFQFKNFECLNDDVLLPSWNKIIGLTDITYVEMVGTMNQSVSKQNSKNTTSCENGENTMLWTESMQNSMMKEKSNESVIAEIKSWLTQWKNKFCKKEESRKDDSDSDYSGYSSDEDFISNSVIIFGAPGSGKTSLVFSLANELGFTVIEVNASSCRNGRNISHQLKEALESYHVEGIKLEDLANKTTLGSGHNRNIKKSHNLDLNINKTKNLRNFFTAKDKDSEQIKVKSKKEKQNIANFFQVSTIESQSDSQGKNKKRKVEKKEEKEGNYVFNKKKHTNSNPLHLETSIKSDKSSCKISSLTIILFDDVDVVFEEDEGFWSTVKGFLKISKKPVIFTVGRNLAVVKATLNSDIKIFNINPASKEAAVKNLEKYCKEYSRESTNVDLLISHNVNDFRRNILNVQFWTRKPLLHSSEEDKISETANDFVPYSKLVHMNSFLAGDLNFSTKHMRKLLFDNLPHYITNGILEYQSLGFDILHSNFFNILNILKSSTDFEKHWQTLTVEQQKSGYHNMKHTSDSDLWQEACELFKLKKMALKNGSCSKELNSFAEALDDFSYSDMLKGLTCEKFRWVSMSERIKMWTAGLPACSDYYLWTHDDVLDIISLINVYRLRKLQKAISNQYFETAEDIQLVLEHPFMHFDQSFTYKTENDLNCISEVLPPSLQLNRSALSLDYLSAIKIMCQDEEQRQLSSGKRSGRFLHYFDSISFLLDKKKF